MTKEYIVLHHSATSDGLVLRDYDAIKRNHLGLGYRDIGYHWVVEKVNGVLTAIPGRAESDTGAHCPDRNTDGIGICCVGNFEETTPSEELYRFIATLCRAIMARHPIKEIGGHRDYYSTVCPGKNFNVGVIKEMLENELEQVITPCQIRIGDKTFSGYLKGGRSYFGEGVAITDVVKAFSPVAVWNDKELIVKISMGGE